MAEKRLSDYIECPSCHGQGYLPSETTVGRQLCLRCGGTGELYRWSTPREPYIDIVVDSNAELLALRAKNTALTERVSELEREVRLLRAMVEGK